MKESRIFYRLLIVTAILLLANFYVGASFYVRSIGLLAHSCSFFTLFAIFVALQLMAPILMLFRRKRGAMRFPFARLLQWSSFAALGIFSCALFFWGAADIIGLVWQIFSPESVEFINVSFWSVTALTAFATVGGLLEARRGPRVESVEVPIERLPKAFQGFRIVQISDLHVSELLRRRYVE